MTPQDGPPKPETPAGNAPSRWHPTGPAGGREPDYRFSLANERTFLAWIRTCVALLAGGVAVVQLTDFASHPQRLALGLALIAISFLIAASSYRRWWRVERAMRAAQPLPHTWLPAVIAVGLAAVILLTALLLITT